MSVHITLLDVVFRDRDVRRLMHYLRCGVCQDRRRHVHDGARVARGLGAHRRDRHGKRQDHKCTAQPPYAGVHC